MALNGMFLHCCAVKNLLSLSLQLDWKRLKMAMSGPVDGPKDVANAASATSSRT